MHRTRYAAGQRVLDATGNLKTVQALLGHASISIHGGGGLDWIHAAEPESKRRATVKSQDVV